jgi:hypothetical protein
LEATLAGVSLDKVEQAIARFYEQQAIESPGVMPGDLAQALAFGQA